jgi:hypothetical protein
LVLDPVFGSKRLAFVPRFLAQNALVLVPVFGSNCHGFVPRFWLKTSWFCSPFLGSKRLGFVPGFWLKTPWFCSRFWAENVSVLFPDTLIRRRAIELSLLAFCFSGTLRAHPQRSRNISSTVRVLALVTVDDFVQH